MSSSKLLSTTMAFWAGPLLTFTTTHFLILLAVAYTKRWGDLSVYFGSFMRSMRALCFYTIAGDSGEDCKCSNFFSGINTSHFCGLTLALKAEPIIIKIGWPTECVWAAATCGYSFTWRKTHEVSSSKSIISLGRRFTCHMSRVCALS